MSSYKLWFLSVSSMTSFFISIIFYKERCFRYQSKQMVFFLSGKHNTSFLEYSGTYSHFSCSSFHLHTGKRQSCSDQKNQIKAQLQYLVMDDTENSYCFILAWQYRQLLYYWHFLKYMFPCFVCLKLKQTARLGLKMHILVQNNWVLVKNCVLSKTQRFIALSGCHVCGNCDKGNI